MKNRVAVLVKQVPDLEAAVAVAADDRLEIEERWCCSFYDEIAMEAALQLQKEQPGLELVALSAGGKRAADALRRAVAMGIDQVEQIGDESLERADSLGVAMALAARLKQLDPCLVLCGKQALDDDQAAVGPMVAELLGIPHASAVVSLALEADGKSCLAGRKSEGEICQLRLGLPALVSAEKGLCVPRLPQVMRVMKAMKAKIPQVQTCPFAEPAERVRHLRYLPPPKRPPVTMMQQPFPQNVAELVSHLRRTGAL